jgi:hypothetical protein
MTNTTILIPIHELNEVNKPYFQECIKGLSTQKDKNFNVLFISPENLTETISEIAKSSLEGITFECLTNPGLTDYTSQINEGVKNVKTAYFSIVQMDDVVFPNHTLNINKYISAYPNVDVFVPLTYEVDTEDSPLGFSNESVWAINSMKKFGYFDLKGAKEHLFYNYNINCLTMKTECYTQTGGLKRNMKRFQDYEHLLRMLNLGKSIFVIPKISYKHVNGVKGSIMESQTNMSEQEKKFWLQMAKKEYFFDFDRELNFIENEQEGA